METKFSVQSFNDVINNETLVLLTEEFETCLYKITRNQNRKILRREKRVHPLHLSVIFV